MADFAPLITRAIAGLEKNTAENRRVLYDRARSALVAQLRSIDPPLSESEITRERLGLEEAIRRIELEIARGQRETSLRGSPAAAGQCRTAGTARSCRPQRAPAMPPSPPRSPGRARAGRDAAVPAAAPNAGPARSRPESTG